MKKKKILLVFGTRPEAIKMAPLVKGFNDYKKEFDAVTCVTAQHRQMLDDVLKTFDIKPEHDLNIMQDGQTLYHITSAALTRMEKVLAFEKPDLVLVHGDTTTTFAASLASFYQKIPVGHVEAGLRSYNKHHPFPEEANRLLTDSISDLYFAPTSTAKKALIKENINPKKIFITGNTVIDALKMVLSCKKGFENHSLVKLFPYPLSPISYPLILVTAHRRENFGKPVENVFHALRRIAEKYQDVKIVYPVHLNPNVQEPAKRIMGNIDNIHLLEPLNYSDLAGLMKLSRIVVTDSGGLQEEAPTLGKPVLVLREVTERPEAVKSGTVSLIGTNEEKVFSQVSRLLSDKKHYRSMSNSVNPYGDGKAAVRTIEAIRYYFGLKKSPPKDFSPQIKVMSKVL